MYHRLTEIVLGEEFNYFCLANLNDIFAMYRSTNDLYLHPNQVSDPSVYDHAYVVEVNEDHFPQDDPDFLYKEKCFKW